MQSVSDEKVGQPAVVCFSWIDPLSDLKPWVSESMDCSTAIGIPSNAKTESNRAAQQTATIAIAIKVAEINSLIQQLQTIFEPRLSTITPGRVYELSVREPSIRTSLIFDPNNGRMVLSGPTTIIGQLKSLVERLSDSQTMAIEYKFIGCSERTIRLCGTRFARSMTNAQDHREHFAKRSESFYDATWKYDSTGYFQTISDQGNSKPAEQHCVNLRGGLSLTDLDVILLRGRQPDLDQLSEVIEQLERISEDTQPTVQILPLQHASSEGIATIIETVSDDLIGGRQGRVLVTPLVKPNALLLIGWGDSVSTIIDLAKKLDTPVVPSTQSTVFRLKHASAETVAAAVESFLEDRAGLGPKVTVTPDLRTNSLVVYAAPRDLMEVRKLIDDLDQPMGRAILETKIIQIKSCWQGYC